AYPCSGTSRASTRSGDPANVTAAPRARSASATASDGARCPTVPPAAIRHRSSLCSGMATSDVKEDPDGQGGYDEARPAVRHERERDAGERREPEHCGEVDRRLPAYERGDARGEALSEGVLARDGQSETCIGERAVAGDEDGGADEPELLRDHREDHVGVRLRQVVDLLDPLTEAAAEEPAGADADLCLHVLQAGAERVLPRVDEREETRAAVRRGPCRNRACAEHERVRDTERGERRPRHEQDGADHDDDRDDGAEVGLGEDERAEDADEQSHRAREIFERARRRATREIGGRPHDERELRQFRRLERRRTEADPPARAVHARADDEHGEAERERGADERRRKRSQRAEVGARRDDEEREAEDGVDPLPLQVARRVAVAERRGGRRRAVHHDQTERGQRERDEDEQLPFEAALLHASSSTMRRNVSPRSSKFRNWSKLAVAGESRTTSPGCASSVACEIAVVRSPSRTYGTPAASNARARSSETSPIRWMPCTQSGIAWASGAKSCPFCEPPRITCSGMSSYAAIARSAAPTVVAFESLT